MIHISRHKIDGFFYFMLYSASLSGGNLVEGVPRVLYTEAVGVPHGGVGPAIICILDFRELKFEDKYG